MTPPPLPSSRSPSRRTLIRPLIVVAICTAVGGAGYLAFGFFSNLKLLGPRSDWVASGQSPDGKWVATWDQVNGFIDHNFELRVREVRVGSVTQLAFRSPDERPCGRDPSQLKWSDDGTKLLIVGGNYDTIDSAPRLSDGRVTYLLYDLSTREIRCNSSQMKSNRVRFADLDGFSALTFRVE